VEGLEHTAHLTAVTAGKPDKTLFLMGFATGGSIAYPCDVCNGGIFEVEFLTWRDVKITDS